LTILVGALWLTAAAGDFALRTGLVHDEAYSVFITLPFFLSFIPLLFALIGMHLRFHPSSGSVGRIGLGLSVVGCAGVIVSVLAIFLQIRVLEAVKFQWVNPAVLACFLSIRIGYILFGVDALRFRMLGRGSLLPLLVGLSVVLSLPLTWFGVPAILPAQWASPLLHFGISGACWLLLGLSLLSHNREPQPLFI
jgi:hypothetical protein